ncbi:MAG TPA: ubiquinone/menaquinone biosynthesis methyltransferase [Candidatus Binataceae bacterium]|nr:ubiquinone/menaquinone biosynthesis methyltransferase [Candidatus Binataceae bacterium]
MDAGDQGKPARIREMFGRIVPRYDTVNSLMTLGLDARWRRETVAMAQPRGADALDIATGTGELAFEMVRQGARMVSGVDFCLAMVQVAQRKRVAASISGRLSFATGDAMALPFHDNTFDCIVNGFMLRNVADLPTTFAEMERVLRPGGRLVCLDLTPPRGPMKPFFKWYIALWVPLLGVVVGRDYAAYRYLFQSLSIHPDADRVAEMMRHAGFGEVSYTLSGFNTVALHRGVKPAAQTSDVRGANQSSGIPQSSTAH